MPDWMSVLAVKGHELQPRRHADVENAFQKLALEPDFFQRKPGFLRLTEQRTVTIPALTT